MGSDPVDVPVALASMLNGEEVDGIPGTGWCSCCCVEVLSVDGIEVVTAVSSGVFVVDGDDGDGDDDVGEEDDGWIVVEGNMPEFLDKRL